MSKEILILTIVCLCLLLGMGIISYAGPFKDTATIQEHIKVHLEKVKLKNPQKYKFMIERAGGNVTQCTDCHQELLKGNLPSQKGIESIRPLRK